MAGWDLEDEGLVLSSAKVHFGEQKGEHEVSPLHYTDDASQGVNYILA